MFELTDSGVAIHFDLIWQWIVAHLALCILGAWLLYGHVLHRIALPSFRLYNHGKALALIEKKRWDAKPLSRQFWQKLENCDEYISSREKPFTSSQMAFIYVIFLVGSVIRAVVLTLWGILWTGLNLLSGASDFRGSFGLIFGHWVFTVDNMVDVVK